MIKKYPELYKKKRLTLFSDGIFDLFHYGHLNYLKKIKEYFNIEVYLIIGIINDELSMSYKRQPIFSENQSFQRKIRYFEVLARVARGHSSVARAPSQSSQIERPHTPDY